MNLYLKQEKRKPISIEDKIKYIKINKSRLKLPVDDYLTDEHLDSLLFEIKNNWNTTGYQYHEMIDKWYEVLTN